MLSKWPNKLPYWSGKQIEDEFIYQIIGVEQSIVVCRFEKLQKCKEKRFFVKYFLDRNWHGWGGEAVTETH